MRVLLAVDGSSYSDLAVEEVARRPWPTQTEVKVISAAAPPLLPGTEPWANSAAFLEEMEKAINERAQAVVDGALEKLKTSEDKTIVISSEVVPGSAGQVIVEEAEAWSADLIVMGSRGLGGWNRLLLGSVSDNVLHHAKCSVEIVRKASAHAGDKN